MITFLPPVPAPFVYNATVLSFHDGDTGLFFADRGVRDYSKWDIRLVGCNAIELDDPGGEEALASLTARLPIGTAVVLTTVKPDKFGGRLDASVTYRGPTGESRDLVTDLVMEGWAATWNGQGKKPVPVWPRVVHPEMHAALVADRVSLAVARWPVTRDRRSSV